MDSKNKQEILDELAQFTGTTQMWEHKTFNGRILLTDGCDYVRKACKAYWLFDLIFSRQKELAGEEFQTWILTSKGNGKFEISCDDGDDNILFRYEIPFSDFPLNSISIWVIEGVCLLPNEY